ncbi:MAG: hypothetical protein NW220_24105 [Leptolyngbyaceae cyanobacterium bins.349]|nr:hypothetical protein [Leptolyngbyaceae cyanobacterium bins.349]
MQDFAYLYLAFDHDCDREVQGATPESTVVSSNWAAPIEYGSRSGGSTVHADGSTIQDPEVDFETYSYPSFYL